MSTFTFLQFLASDTTALNLRAYVKNAMTFTLNKKSTNAPENLPNNSPTSSFAINNVEIGKSPPSSPPHQTFVLDSSEELPYTKGAYDTGSPISPEKFTYLAHEPDHERIHGNPAARAQHQSFVLDSGKEISHTEGAYNTDLSQPYLSLDSPSNSPTSPEKLHHLALVSDKQKKHGNSAAKLPPGHPDNLALVPSQKLRQRILLEELIAKLPPSRSLGTDDNTMQQILKTIIDQQNETPVDTKKFVVGQVKGSNRKLAPQIEHAQQLSPSPNHSGSETKSASDANMQVILYRPPELIAIENKIRAELYKLEEQKPVSFLERAYNSIVSALKPSNWF